MMCVVLHTCIDDRNFSGEEMSCRGDPQSSWLLHVSACFVLECKPRHHACTMHTWHQDQHTKLVQPVCCSPPHKPPRF